MLINETQLPHLKVKPENLERHLRAADHRSQANKCGRKIIITYSEQKGSEGDLLILPGVGLVVLTAVEIYDFREMFDMAVRHSSEEGFCTHREYLSELTRCYQGIPSAFFVHTFLEIRRPADD